MHPLFGVKRLDDEHGFLNWKIKEKAEVLYTGAF
jgi:hypothetical protein